MSAQAGNTSESSVRRRPPLWPWLLMPLATLAIFFVLWKARQSPPHTPTQITAPGEAAETAAPGAESN